MVKVVKAPAAAPLLVTPLPPDAGDVSSILGRRSRKFAAESILRCGPSFCARAEEEQNKKRIRAGRGGGSGFCRNPKTSAARETGFKQLHHHEPPRFFFPRLSYG